MSKGYGLIIPGKQKEVTLIPKPVSRPSVFDDETSSSSSDGDRPKVRGKFQGPTIGPGAMERRQARSIQEKALAEDPTIFQYDELYDEIETKRDEEKKSKTVEKKPKYIGRLLQQAERRKLENERRIERQVQKEREAEGEQFKDKESFVTSAYKKKLEELKIAEEAEKREEYLEAIGDVTKQGNLDGFYRHLYEQKLGPKEIIESKSIDEKISETADDSNIEGSLKIKPIAKPRVYRKRQSSEDDEAEIENSVSKKAHIQSNLDADSDFSIDDSSSEEETEPNGKINNDSNMVTKEAIPVKLNIKIEPGTEPTNIVIGEKQQNNNDVENIKTEIKEEKVKDEEKEEKPKPKIKIDIWKKRTVGEVFDAALQRYYERKNAKNG